MDKSDISQVEETARQLLQKLSIDCQVSVSASDEWIDVKLEAQEAGLLIGFHGNTLYSFQLILALLVYKKLGTWRKIVVDVGNYRQKREESLKSLADQSAQQVIDSQQEVVLPYLPSNERRIIHLFLQDHAQVTTESTGEGKNRRIIIKLK